MLQKNLIFAREKKRFLILILLLPFIFLLITAAGPAAATSGDRITEVHPLPSHTFVLTENGSVWAWGDNQHGKLGDGTTTSRTVPIQPLLDELKELYPQSAGHTFALKKDGTLWAWERNWDGRLGTGNEKAHHSTPVQILADVDKVFPGSRHSFALKNDGTLWGWGKNSHGQIGDGTTVSRFEPVRIDLDNPARVIPGENNTFAILRNGALWSWGNNQHGKLGDGTTSNRSKPVKIMNDVKNVYPQANHTIAHKNDQTIWSWGHNWYGQLGTGSGDNHPEPTQINLAQVTDVYSEQYHTFALKADATLWSWGHNWYGQLGDGTITNRHQPVQVPLDNITELHPQKHHTFALQEDKTLWGWGHNWDGRIGDNSSAHIRPAPVEISKNINRAYVLEKHAFALDNTGTALAWGDNGKAQLGSGAADGSTNPAPLELEDVAAIYPQDSHTFALKTDGSLWAWGDNSRGQLGVGNYQLQEDPVQVLLGSDLPVYTISLSADPPEGGVLSGDGEYRHGQSVSISASAIPGYSFINWTEDGQKLSAETDFSFIATEDRNLVANFKAPPEEEAPVKEEDAVDEETAESFEIILSTDPEDGGSVEGAGTFEEGSDITVSAESNEGYLFLNWTEIIPHNGLNGDIDTVTDIEVVVSEEKEYIFEVTRNRELTANFEPLEEELPSPGIMEISAENATTTITFDRSLEEKPALNHFTVHYMAETIAPLEEEPMGGIDLDLGTEETDFYQFNLDNEEQDDATRFFEHDPANDDDSESNQENGNDENGHTEEEEDQTGPEDPADIDNEDEDEAKDSETETNETEDDENWQTLELTGLDWDQEQPDTVTLSFEPFAPAEKDISYTIKIAYLEDEAVKANPFTVEAKPASTYQLSLAADPEEAGILEGEGSYEEGEEISVTAKAAEGYEFLNWTLDDDIISTESEFTYTMPGKDITLTAVFEAKPASTYQLILAADPEEAGTLEGEGSYEEGEEISVTAKAAEGYEFLNWTLDDDIISTESEFTYTMPGKDVTLTAVFEAKPAPTYQLSLAADPEGAGILEGEGSYEEGEEISVTAKAAEGYEFLNWTLDDDIISTESDFTYTMPGKDVTLTAAFHKVPEMFEISLAVEPEEAGSTSGGGKYQQGLTAAITAEANAGFDFVSWTEPVTEIVIDEESGEEITTETLQVVSEDIKYSFTVEQDRNLTANFEAVEEEMPPAEIETAEAENGTITAVFDSELEKDPELEHFETHYLAGEAEMDETEDDENWQTLELTELDWAQDQPNTVTLSFEPFAPAERDISYTIKIAYLEDEAVKANPFNEEAKPAPTYQLSLAADPEEAGTLEGEGSYEEGEEISVTAKAAEGYEFLNWTLDDEIISTENDFTYTMPGEDITLTAAFEAKPASTYQLSLAADPEEAGTLEGEGSYEEGEEISVSAKAAEGYEFLNWSLDDEIISTESEFTYTMPGEDVTLTAAFEAKPDIHYLELNAQPGYRGKVKGEGIYGHGEEAVVIAEPEPNYVFYAWMDGDDIVSYNPNYSFEVVSDLKLVALFEQEENTFYISLQSNPEEIGTLHGEGVYIETEEAIIKTVPDEGYMFTGWTENDEIISEESEYSFEVTDDRELTANFALKPEETEDKNAVGGSDVYTDRENLSGSNLETNSLEVLDYQNPEPAESYSIELSIEPEGRGTVTGAGKYEAGKLVGLDAEPKEGYRFAGWFEAYPSYENEDDHDFEIVEYVMVSQAKKYAFEANRDRTLTATFETLKNRRSERPEPFKVALSSRPRMGGKVYGSGDYTEGKAVTITALPDLDFRFINWTKNGEEVSTDIIYTFRVESDLELVANFEPIENGYFIEPDSSSYNEHDPFLDSYLAEYLLPGTAGQWKSPQGGNPYQ